MPGASRPQGLALPQDFVFGVTTSAVQVEGALAEDGRGASVWETFADLHATIRDGSRPGVGVDHYRHVDEDVALLRELGVDSYRFSVAWPRVMPEGRGRINPAGLDHYDRLVDSLLEAGIDPMVTLYHGDLPQALEDDGGWLNRATADAFAAYAQVVGERLADRVGQWVPISEPNVIAMLGYALGEHAPGKRLQFDVMPVVHHLLLGHGRAVAALRGVGARSIGSANNHSPMWPASEDPADVGVTKLFDALWNGSFMEPMLLGRYPQDLAPLLDGFVHDGDLAVIRQPLDFYGISYYSPIRVAASDEEAELPFRFLEVLGHQQTASGWAVVPSALREWLILLRARFRAALPPLVITESGSSWAEQPAADGTVHDADRIAYLEDHLDAVAQAVERGVDVRGFYVWSLLDSWEWSNGWTAPYGLVRVDRETGVRTPKDSFGAYAEMIRARRAVH